jgi:hypothetical protein
MVVKIGYKAIDNVYNRHIFAAEIQPLSQKLLTTKQNNSMEDVILKELQELKNLTLLSPRVPKGTSPKK